MRLFRSDEDFEAFRRVMVEAYRRHPLRILAYCVLSNHWHFVVWPKTDGQVTDYFRWLTHTHAMRWRVAHRTVGYGPVYQGRFKSFPVQSDEHLLTVARYVERNALGAGLVERAELWPYGSLHCAVARRGPDAGDSRGVAHRSSRRLGGAGQRAAERRGVETAAPQRRAGPPFRHRRLDGPDGAAAGPGAHAPARRTPTQKEK